MAKTPIKQLKPGNEGQIPRTAGNLVVLVNHIRTIKDKELIPIQTYGNGFYTGLTISATPITDGYVKIKANGIQQALGDGTNAKDCYFTSDIPFNDVGGGNGPAFALRADKSAWAWGDNSSGAVGDNTTVNKSSPTSVIGAHSFVILRNGGAAMIALKSDGTVWTWGGNTNGRIGDNTTTPKSSPVSVVGNHSAVQITCDGGGYAGLLKSDGTMWSWGGNSSGGVGDNTTNDRSSPVSVVGAHSFLMIFPGLSGLALKSDGSAWSWGVNNVGQLGDNTTNSRSSPVSIIGSHSFRQVITGGLISAIGLKADGSVWSWGSGANGANGDNTTISRSSPVSIVGGHSFILVTCQGVSNSHSLGLKSDGTIWAWGTNADGEIGDNTTVNKSSPISVLSGGLKFTTIGIGNELSYAQATDGSIWAWGLNSSGQLGDNTTINRSSPISIVGGSATIRSIANIAIGDKLIWNGNRSGFNLLPTDKIDMNYI